MACFYFGQNALIVHANAQIELIFFKKFAIHTMIETLGPILIISEVIPSFRQPFLIDLLEMPILR